MKRLLVLTMLTASLFTISCTKQKNTPFGAENIDYDKVEAINKNGPILSGENNSKPPMADKVYVEEGPKRVMDENAGKAPEADLSLEPDYGGIPIVKKPGVD